MKKFSILLVMIVLLSGCSKSIVCTSDNVKVDIITNGDNIKTITAYFEYESEEAVNAMCQTMKNIVNNKEDVTCDNKTIKIVNYEKNIIIDEMNKDNVIKYFENQDFTCE